MALLQVSKEALKRTIGTSNKATHVQKLMDFSSWLFLPALLRWLSFHLHLYKLVNQLPQDDTGGGRETKNQDKIKSLQKRESLGG